MTPSSFQAQPCRNRDCRGDHEPAERVAMAASLCGERGAQLTALRKKILELLWAHERPAGAYELIEALRNAQSRPVGPPTVYRALEFLTSQGLVSKIESRNAYVPCAHPERRHDCLFVICTDCGSSVEFEDPRIERLLAENAAKLGYQVERRIVEVEGKCADCAQAAASSHAPESPA